MSSIDDEEDRPPLEPPPTVPESEAPFPPLPPWASSSSFPPPPPLPSAASTEPSPPSETPGGGFSTIIRKLDELLELRRADSTKLAAIDLGITVLFDRLDVLEGKVEKLIQICTDEGNGLFAISKDLQDLRDSILQQKDHDGAKVKRLEQSVADLERAAGSGGE